MSSITTVSTRVMPLLKLELPKDKLASLPEVLQLHLADCFSTGDLAALAASSLGGKYWANHPFVWRKMAERESIALNHVITAKESIKIDRAVTLIAFCQRLPAGKAYMNKHSLARFSLFHQAQRLREWMATDPWLQKMTSLELTHRSLNKIPSEIGLLKKLRLINFSNNNLEALPQAIGKLPCLKVIILNNNRFGSLPHAVISSRRLLRLELSGNQITALPNLIRKLRKMVALELSSNQIRELPDQLFDLTKITSLKLNDNPLKALSARIVNWQRLSILDVRNQDLPLPDVIANLANLSRLIIHSSQVNENSVVVLSSLRSDVVTVQTELI